MKRIIALLLATALFAFNGAAALAEGIIVIGEDNHITNSYGGETELKPGSKMKVDGNYTISIGDPASACFSKEKDLAGYHYLYFTTKEDGSPIGKFEGPIGTHTILYVGITLLNLAKKETNWLKRVKCDVVYDEKYPFETFATQVNPDQKDADGNIQDGTPSAEARPTEPLVSTDVEFYVAVPYIVRDSDKPLWAYITVDEDVYSVNLREVMVIDTDID